MGWGKNQRAEFSVMVQSSILQYMVLCYTEIMFYNVHSYKHYGYGSKSVADTSVVMVLRV